MEVPVIWGGTRFTRSTLRHSASYPADPNNKAMIPASWRDRVRKFIVFSLITCSSSQNWRHPDKARVPFRRPLFPHPRAFARR